MRGFFLLTAVLAAASSPIDDSAVHDGPCADRVLTSVYILEYPLRSGFRVKSETCAEAKWQCSKKQAQTVGGLRVDVQEPSFDLDRVGDLDLLARARSPATARLCGRTLAYLDEHDLWRYAKNC